jgi:predicted acyltransferase
MKINTAPRIASIDALRGITILAMLFVNDITGVDGAPAWMKHISPSHADGMTFADVVFPAFLFIVGMSIPLAIGRRLERGETLGIIWKHILIRTFSLLVIGIFMVNTESHADRGILNPHVWSLLMYLGVILLWNSPFGGKKTKNAIVLALKITGVVIILFLVFVYRGNGAQVLIQMRVPWWGILGLIGWAYLIGCAAYLPLRRKLPALIGVMALLYCGYMAGEAFFFTGLWNTQWSNIGIILGSHGAIVISGVILGIIIMPGSSFKTNGERIRWALFYGLGLASAAVLLHALHDIHWIFTINKNLATPPWGLWSSAFMVWSFLAIYWLIDVKRWKGWAVVVKPAGRNALFAYILAPMIYSAFALLEATHRGFGFYSRLGSGYSTGLWRSLVFAFVVTWLAGGLSCAGIRLKI